jgi:hypothetical protein
MFAASEWAPNPATLHAVPSCRRRASECADGNSSSSDSDALNPAEQCLLEGLTDQLDATDAELEHLTQQLQQQQAAIAAAGAAAAALRSKADGMSSRQLALLLQQVLDVLVEQGSHWAAVVHKVRIFGIGSNQDSLLLPAGFVRRVLVYVTLLHMLPKVAW